MRPIYLSLTAVLLAGCVLCQSPPLNLTHCPTEPGGDQRPVFSVNISDSTPIGTPLLVFSSRLSISLHNNCRADIFSLNSSTFILNKALKHVCDDSLSCILNCRVSDARYDIILQFQISRNENYTLEFKQKNYHANVSENPTPGWFSDYGGTTEGIVKATSLVDYDLLNDTNNVTLTIKAQLTQPSLIANRNVSASTNLIVTIQDVDDTGPVFKDNVYELNITEENSGLSGNPYKTFPPIHAYDGDRGINETIIYSIEDEMKSKFSINNMTGEISVLQELDADGGRDLYVMTIKATQQDNRFRTAISTLSLSVVDIDDNPPIFSPNNYNCNITEHSAVGQVICRVTATDKDKGQYGQLTFELENGSAVDVDPISGDIQVKDSQKLDREEESYLFLQVLAKSSDGNKTDKANVTINLIDINDNYPVFNQSSFNFSVRNISIGEYVGKISASDMDSSDNQKFIYTLGMCLSNIGVCSGDNMKCHFPFLIDPVSGNITVNGCTARCIYSSLVSVCDSSHYFTRGYSKELIAEANQRANKTNRNDQIKYGTKENADRIPCILVNHLDNPKSVIQVEDSSNLPFFNRISSVQENAANNSQVSQFPAKGNMNTSLRCSPVYPDSTTTPTSEATGSTVLIISTVVGSVLAVIVVGVIVHYCLILRRRRAKYEKNTRETADAERQEMEGQKENSSNIEDVYDKITDLPDDYLTVQDITPTVDESEEREGSYEKLRNADKNASEGYSLLNTLTTNECESKAMKHENKEQITSTGETNMHSKEPHDDHTNEDVQQ